MSATAQLRVTQLAAMLPVHRAFHWLHLHQLQLRRWQLEMLAIPAPPFAEARRAAWFLERFEALGAVNSHIDNEGNVLGELPGLATALNPPYLLLSAHLDTVFPAGIDTQPREDGPRILGPGACDNGAGLTALLGALAALQYAGITPPVPILFCANTGEEGEGDLRGMRQLFLRGPYRGRIGAALALEGSGTATLVTRALGSRRFRATINGPGGHSWSDASTPNPITLISRGIAHLADLRTFQPTGTDEIRTTLSPGRISGGTSVNSIPQSATVDLDLRSTEAAELDVQSELIRTTFESLVREANLDSPETLIEITFTCIGDRPAAVLPASSFLLETVRAVDRHLGLRTEVRLGSTDANIPLSLGIPAAAIASGGTGGNIHTLEEWYDPTGRELALRRVVLVLLDVAQSLALHTEQDAGSRLHSDS